MLNAKQLRYFVIRPALKRIALWSSAAENLVLGTFQVESDLREIDQGGDLTPGPAYGLGQMERKTYDDIWQNYLTHHPQLKEKVLSLASWHATPPPVEELYGNLFFASAMTRVHYRRVSEALPAPRDVTGMCLYWKVHYNTLGGKGDPWDLRVRRAFIEACS